MGIFIDNNEEVSSNNITSSFDLIRGFAYLILAFFLYTSKNITLSYGKNFVAIFAILATVYGLFRVWRGIHSILNKRKKGNEKL